MKTKQMAAWGVGALALVILAAGASALVTREVVKEDKPAIEKSAKAPKAEKITWNDAPPAQQQAAAKPACDDGNIVGHVLGGVGGGVAGSQIGKGSGKTVATIGGALGGAYLGGEFIPTKNVTCR